MGFLRISLFLQWLAVLNFEMIFKKKAYNKYKVEPIESQFLNKLVFRFFCICFKSTHSFILFLKAELSTNMFYAVFLSNHSLFVK